MYDKTRMQFIVCRHISLGSEQKRAKLEENCELQATDTVQRQIFVHIFEAKSRQIWFIILQIFSIKINT